MAKTYANLLSEAREILQDTFTDASLQRYSDATLTDILNRGLLELYRLRPDAFYDFWNDAEEDFDVPVVSTLTDTFALPLMFYGPLVSFVIGATETIDDEFSDDSRAMAFLSDFKSRVVGL